MTAYASPPVIKNKILNAKDTLTVNANGRSEDITINADATETVNQGGTAFRTTVDDDGLLVAEGGTINNTTINGGQVGLHHATATGVRINFSNFSQFSVLFAIDHSTVKDTIIQGGTAVLYAHGMAVDATSTAVNVTFEKSTTGKVGAELALENPQNFKGFIKGLSAGDVIAFGKTFDGAKLNINVTDFHLTNQNHTLTIDYNTNQHATFQLQSTLPNTDPLQGVHFKPEYVKDDAGHIIGSELFVVANKLGAPPPSVTAEQIQNDCLGITQTPLSLDDAALEANAINAGVTTEIAYVTDLLSQVADTTFPAVAVEGSMYGAVGSLAEITKLVTQFLPTQVENALQNGFVPQVYASEALGLAFAFSDENGGAAFATKFGPSNPAMPATAAGDAAFAAAAANAIFGSGQNANSPSAILGWVSNWEAFYTAHGIPGIANPTTSQIDLAARGVAWGDAVGVALANKLGSLPGQVTNFLEDAAQGTAVYSASLASQPTPAPFEGAASATSSAAAVQLIGVAATPSDPMLAGHHT
jgi:autotransporter passenger strand-loop-strand repeat protein